MPSLLGKHASFQNEIDVIWFSVISLSIQPYAKNIPLGNNSLESFFVHIFGQTNNSVICERNLSFLEQVHFVSGLTSRKFNIISSRAGIWSLIDPEYLDQIDRCNGNLYYKTSMYRYNITLYVYLNLYFAETLQF